MAEVRTRAGVDAFVNENKPKKNFREKFLTLDRLGGNERQAFIFASPPWQRHKQPTIVSAYLRVYTYGTWAAGYTVRCRRVTTGWAASGVTWNNRPTRTDTNLVDVVVPANSGQHELLFDITAMMQAVSNFAAFYGFHLSLTAGSGAVKLHSSRTHLSGFQPSIEVEWSSPPAAPNNLRPSGNRRVHTASPILTWQFIDDPGEAQAQFQVQLDDASDFATPLHDSGWVASGESQYDLGAAGVTLADADTRYWRVRAQDAYGMTSEWSTVSQFTRDIKGTLALTSPTGGVTNDATPLIEHTFTGETQRARKYFVWEKTSAGVYPTTPRHESVIFNDAVLSYELPAGVIRFANRDYKVTVRVWDTEDREDTPGDPSYVEDTEEFHLELGAVDPVTNLTATMATEPWKVTVAWQRATAPDYFAIVVDGEIMEDLIDPADVLVSGTSYAKDVAYLQPGVEHDIEVHAVEDVGGILNRSGTNPTATLTPRVQGIWLVVPEEDLSVVLRGPYNQSFAIGESGETLLPVGSRRAVRIVDSVRGYEGSVSGLLTSIFGRDIDEWRDRLEEIKELQNTAETRLLIGNLNFPVIIGEIGGPTPGPELKTYEVDIPFWQDGEFRESIL